jgi:hypothetical protein
MNQDQRKFLIKQVEATFARQLDKLVKPEPPSLNNYLVAAVLDGTIQYKSIDVLRNSVKRAVLALGPSDTFVQYADRWHRKRRVDDEEAPTLTMAPDVIFVYPRAYLEAEEEYEQKREEYQEAVATLENLRDTIVMKIQIGSNEVLDRLIRDVDNMGDLRVINTQLLLGVPPQRKKITR